MPTFKRLITSFTFLSFYFIFSFLSFYTFSQILKSLATSRNHKYKVFLVHLQNYIEVNFSIQIAFKVTLQQFIKQNKFLDIYFISFIEKTPNSYLWRIIPL